MSDIKEGEHEYIAFSGKVKTNRENLFGIFVVIINKSFRSLESAQLVFSIYSEAHSMDFSQGWHVFEKKIQDMTYGGQSVEAVTFAAQDAMRTLCKSPDFIKEITEFAEKNNKAFIQSMFEEFFDKELNDSKIEISVSIETIGDVALQEGRVRPDARAETQDPKEEGGDEGPKAAMVRSKLVLAPVGGKLVTELKAGDQIMVRLEKVGVRESALIESMQLVKENGEIKPCACKVVGINPSGKGVDITVQIDENTISKIYEEERVLVKLFNPLKDLGAPKATPPSAKTAFSQNHKGAKKEKTKGKASGKSPVLLISASILILLALAIAYMLVSG